MIASADPTFGGTADTGAHARPDTAGDALRRGLPPVVGGAPRLLVLGSFPGEASLAQARYYAHPRNQFWPILGALLDEPLPDIAYTERLERLKARHIALWDVVAECRRQGSLDSAIRDARGNAIERLLDAQPSLRAIAFNGAAAARAQPRLAARGLVTYRLPSSSPAHAGMSLAHKIAQWRVLRDDGWIGVSVP